MLALCGFFGLAGNVPVGAEGEGAVAGWHEGIVLKECSGCSTTIVVVGCGNETIGIIVTVRKG